MSRRHGSSARRGGSFPFSGVLHQKSKTSPLLSLSLSLMGLLLLIICAYGGSGLFGGRKVERVSGDFSCTLELQSAIPVLKEAYGESIKKILHIGPDTCLIVPKLLKEGQTEAWGVEPYDIEDVDQNCKSLVQRGIVRVADIKFPLPYRSNSFSHIIISDTLDYLSPKNLNKTLPELARVSADGIIIFTGYPGQQKAKVAQLSKFGRPAKMRSPSWWTQFFDQNGLDENETAIKKFEQSASKISYNPTCQVFHLNSYQ